MRFILSAFLIFTISIMLVTSNSGGGQRSGSPQASKEAPKINVLAKNQEMR